VPVIGDLMTARWSFEAIAVKQFGNNRYERHYFDHRQAESQNLYYSSFLINSKLNGDLWFCKNNLDSISKKSEVEESFARISYHIGELAQVTGFDAGSWVDSINIEQYNQNVNDNIVKLLAFLKKYFMDLKKQAAGRIDSVSKSLTNALGENSLIDLRDNFENQQLLTLVLNRDNKDIAFKTPSKYLQKLDPGYMKPTSRIGRAHFYAPCKVIGNIEIDTYWFNIIVVWAVTLILYLTLYFNLPEKLISFLESFRLQKAEA
ncbi:MAG: hypothetical protein IQL11_12985, partial [Bacteroidales bacterium]|nr:hypothetical protein [Bacteroidales bacterium]